LAEPLRCVICGATGTTGSVIIREAVADPRFEVVSAIAAADAPELGAEIAPGVTVTASMDAALDRADAVIDFSAPPATATLVSALLERPRPLVVGTTGLPEDLQLALARLADAVPLVIAPNMGLGINVLRRLVQQAAAVLGADWDAEIVEIHHRRKVDAPSGTALALATDLAGAAGVDDAPVLKRAGLVGPRSDGEIGVQALRGGDVVGEHTVYLLGEGERIELTHRATDRTTFALGALRAVDWLLAPGRLPGRYSMNDVLFGPSHVGS